MGRTHPNVLKVRKQKRKGRRAYLTSVYSLIQVPRSVGVSGIPENAKALFAYRERGKGFYDGWLETIFPGRKSTSIERKYAIERAEQERLLAFCDQEDVCDFHTVRDYPLQNKRLTIVFNRKKDLVYFIEVRYFEQTVYKSKQYGSYDRAMFDFEHKRISWHESLHLESLTLVLPRRG